MQKTHLNGDINIRQISHCPIHDALDIVLAQELRYGLHLLKHPILVRHEAILRKVVGENVNYALAELLLLLGQVRSPDDADGDFLGQGLHELQHI